MSYDDGNDVGSFEDWWEDTQICDMEILNQAASINDALQEERTMRTADTIQGNETSLGG